MDRNSVDIEVLKDNPEIEDAFQSGYNGYWDNLHPIIDIPYSKEEYSMWKSWLHGYREAMEEVEGWAAIYKMDWQIIDRALKDRELVELSIDNTGSFIFTKNWIFS